MTYGELTQGQKLTGTVAADRRSTPRREWTVRGTAPKKVNGRDFVTGPHQFTPDIVRPACCYGRVDPSRRLRRDARVGRRQRRARDARCRDRARRRLRSASSRRPSARRRARPRSCARSGDCPRISRRPTTIYEHLKNDRTRRGRPQRRRLSVGDVAAGAVRVGAARSTRATAFPTSRTCRSSRAPPSPNGPTAS